MPNETEIIAGRVESDGVCSSVRMFQFGNYHESLRREKAPCYWPRGDPKWFRSRRAEFSFDAWRSTEEVITEGDLFSICGALANVAVSGLMAVDRKSVV